MLSLIIGLRDSLFRELEQVRRGGGKLDEIV